MGYWWRWSDPGGWRRVDGSPQGLSELLKPLVRLRVVPAGRALIHALNMS